MTDTVAPPTGPAPALAVDHVSRWYGNVVAVNDISFALGQGVTGLLGPNGAGKTTLLHLLAGLLQPSAGTVTVAGQRAWANPPMYRHLGLVPEREAVHAVSHRPGVRAAQREVAGPPRRRRRRRAGDRHGRPGGRRRPAHRHVLEGHAPADQACRRARPRPADPAPRRAVQRHGPAPTAAHDRAAAVHGRRRVARSSSRRTSSRRSSGWPIRSWSSTPVASPPPATSARSAG